MRRAVSIEVGTALVGQYRPGLNAAQLLQCRQSRQPDHGRILKLSCASPEHFPGRAGLRENAGCSRGMLAQTMLNGASRNPQPATRNRGERL
jgi:hypothetical protein